jgi:hypothetical protein
VEPCQDLLPLLRGKIDENVTAENRVRRPPVPPEPPRALRQVEKGKGGGSPVALPDGKGSVSQVVEEQPDLLRGHSPEGPPAENPLPRLLEGKRVDVRSENGNLLRVHSGKSVQEKHGEGVGLLAGAAPGTPDPDGGSSLSCSNFRQGGLGEHPEGFSFPEEKGLSHGQVSDEVNRQFLFG